MTHLDSSDRDKVARMQPDESVFFTVSERATNMMRLSCRYRDSDKTIAYSLANATVPLALTFLFSNEQVFALPNKAVSGWQQRVLKTLETVKWATITHIE